MHPQEVVRPGTHPPLLPQYVVASVSQRQFTFAFLVGQIASVHRYEAEGYTVIFRRGGYVVLKRPARFAGRPAVPATRTTPASPPTASGQLARVSAEGTGR